VAEKLLAEPAARPVDMTSRWRQYLDGHRKAKNETFEMSEFNATRRRVLEILTVGGLTVTILLPSRWIKPVVESVIVPAHAAASPVTPIRGTTSTTTRTTEPLCEM
jgi:hypothetical protein